MLLSGAAFGTVVGTARADWNATHVFSRDWPPHARCRAVAGVPATLVPALAALGHLLHRRGR